MLLDLLSLEFDQNPVQVPGLATTSDSMLNNATINDKSIGAATLTDI